MAVGVEQLRGAAIAAWGATYAKVNPARGQGVENSELLGHFERRVVWEHDARTSQPNTRGAGGHGRHQHFGRRAHDAGMAVMFADPKTVVAPSLALTGEGQGLANGCVLASARGSNRLIEDG